MFKAAVHPLGAHDASPAMARAHVARLISGRASPEQCGIAALIVSELVTNAVMYGREPIRLALQIEDDTLCVEVLDGDPNVGAVTPPAQDDGRDVPTGRGLRIVDALSRTWGVRPIREGKCVWAAIGMRMPTRV